MKAKISVIVPVYNVEEYLPKCIESIRNQTHKNIEIILVNDGSTDRCGNICNEYAALDHRIKVIHQKNEGLAGARNTGIEAATGEYLAFVDSDDWIDADMYEVLHNLIIENEADIAMCRVREISQKGIIDESTNDIVVCDSTEALILIVTKANNYKLEHGITNKLIKWELIRNFRFPKGKLMEDLYFTPPLIYTSKKCVYINKAKYNYLTDRENSIMNAKVSEKMINDELNGYQVLEDFFASKEINHCLTLIREIFLSRLLYFYFEVKNSPLNNKDNLLFDLEELFKKNYLNSDLTFSSSARLLQSKLFYLSPQLFYRLKEQVRNIKTLKYNKMFRRISF